MNGHMRAYVPEIQADFRPVQAGAFAGCGAEILPCRP